MPPIDPAPPALAPASVVLGVGGGIAAYKACEVLRGLAEAGRSVRVVPTRAALHFVGEATWAALSGQSVATDVWADAHEVPHVRIGQQADLVLVAPATADLMARAAHGLADDLLANVLLTARCPVVFAPAMHTEMWEHPATQANVALLRERGCVVLEPAVGRLTGADSGKGRLPEPAAILAAAEAALRRGSAPADLAGRRVVVSAGGTREPLDPVRFLGNRSSGRQGYALAAAAAARGADVVLVAAHTALADPAGVAVIRVGTARELQEAVRSAALGADAVVMAAAVADFRPAAIAPSKIKKSDEDEAPEPVALVRNPDVLAELVAARRSGDLTGVILVGFAAETGEPGATVLDLGRAKLARKGCDLLVVNEVGDGLAFDTPDNAAVILGADGTSHEVPLGPKEVLADVVWDLVAERLAPR